MAVLDPFISATRPHPGQREAALNIRAFLSNSLLSPDKGVEIVGLAQDRYSLRTAPQWIGPQLEDLKLAYDQVSIELNSTTDNPLIDVARERIHHSGNFQAASITSAMEKTSIALQNLGRLLFAQATELVDNSRSKGLPPNLCADDPSLSFTCKGFDVNMAAYMAELASLSHPISAHGVSAEMGNQSVNSMGLVAARRAVTAAEVLCLMQATLLYMLCQALDLRCLHLEFIKVAKPAIAKLVEQNFGRFIPYEDLDFLTEAAWTPLMEKWANLSGLDLANRGETAARDATGSLLASLSAFPVTNREDNLMGMVHQYQHLAGVELSKLYNRCRNAFFQKPTTPKYLGEGSKVVYKFVREKLNIPMHRGLVDHPTLVADERTVASGGSPGSTQDEARNARKHTLGTDASKIYVSLRDDSLHFEVMEAWERL